MSGFMIFTLVLAVLAIVFAFQAIKVVPQQSAWIVERLGKFHGVLSPGLNVVIPFIDRVAYKHSLKEIPLDTGDRSDPRQLRHQQLRDRHHAIGSNDIEKCDR